MSLYKYVTFDRIDILKNEHIRFTQPSAFNDPFELLPFFQSFAPEEYVEELIKTQMYNENGINQMLEESWNNQQKKYPGLQIPFSAAKDLMRKVFESSKPSINEMIRNFMVMKDGQFRIMAIDAITKSLNKSFGILCLTETPDNILMWSHYSANHTGLVFEFDDSHFFYGRRQSENELQGHVRKVRYSKDRPKLTIFNPSLNNEENIKIWINDFLWLKSSDWEY
jgi:hypothetical protein